MPKHCTWALCCLLVGASSAAACGSSDQKSVVRDSGGAGGETAGTGNAGAGRGPRPTDAGAGGQAGAPDSAAGANGGASNDGGATPLGGTASSNGGAGATERGDGGAAFSGLGGAGCDAPVSKLPDLTTGSWLICNGVATNARIWTGVLTLGSETPTCDGAKLTGKFHWSTSNLGASAGDTLCEGTYDAATHQLTLHEYEVTGGNVVTATDTMLYDAASDTMITGAWTCGCSPGAWDQATRIASDGDVTCP